MVEIVCSLSLLSTEILRDTLMNGVLNALPNCWCEFSISTEASFVFDLLGQWHEDPILIEIA